MPFQKHDREYDLVVLGATGYTGKWIVRYISAHVPTNLRWAVAGRSRDKLEQIVSECQALSADRLRAKIEVCSINADELVSLAKKTFILITTIGPYGRYGEPAFKACAHSGTHYLDVTGEVPFVARMIKKYESVAESTGAVMFPQCAIESAPSDMLTWSAANIIRERLQAPTRDVTLAIQTLRGKPSGGTLATVWALLDTFTLSELRAAHVPYALSPIPHPTPSRPSLRPSVSRTTGLVTYPKLGLLTTSLAAKTDAAIVERTWGLLRTIPSTAAQFYGPNFSYRQFYRPRSWLEGVGIHWRLLLFGVLLAIRPLRRIASHMFYQPGEGRSAEEAKDEELEVWAIADADVEGDAKERAFCRASYRGPLYAMCGMIVVEAALTILEADSQLAGGIYTPACLGQPYIDRLHRGGLQFESKIIPV